MKFNTLALLLAVISISGITHAATVESLTKDRAALENEIAKLVKKKEAAHAVIRDSNAQIEAIEQKRREMRSQIAQIHKSAPSTATVAKKTTTQHTAKPVTKAKTAHVTKDTTATKVVKNKATAKKEKEHKAKTAKEKADEKAKEAKTAAVKKRVTRY